MINQCHDSEHKIDSDQCIRSHFPCYSKNTNSCYSKNGEMLFDPVSDIWHGASTAYLAVLDFAERLLMNTPVRQRPNVRRHIRETIHNWGPATIGGPRPLDRSVMGSVMGHTADPALQTNIPLINISENIWPGRYYNAEEIEELGHQIANNVVDVRDQIMGPDNTGEGKKTKGKKRKTRVKKRMGVKKKTRVKKRRE